MPSDRSTPSRTSHKMPHVEPVVRVADRAFLRVVGVIFVLVAMATWFQVKQWQEQSVTQGRQIDALAQALTTEQKNVVNVGETPVAPPPSQIVKNPEVVTGKDGSNGANGINGRDGKDGAPGSPGPSGSPGSPGPSGLPGQEGAPGANGDTVVGPSGAQGERGEKGDTGDRGQQGPPPSGWTFTNEGVVYTCKPIAEDSTNYTCEAQQQAEPSPSSSDTSPSLPMNLQGVALPATFFASLATRRRLCSVTAL